MIKNTCDVIYGYLLINFCNDVKPSEERKKKDINFKQAEKLLSEE